MQININIVFKYFKYDSIKMIHIIDMLYRLNKKGEVKRYERTSDRRTYDYSYE